VHRQSTVAYPWKHSTVLHCSYRQVNRLYKRKSPLYFHNCYVPHCYVQCLSFFRVREVSGSNLYTVFGRIHRRILVAFAKLRRATISFVMSVCPSVRMEQLDAHWTYFHKIWYLSFFRKSVKKIQVSLESNKNYGYFTWRRFDIFTISRWILLRMRNVSDKISRENQDTHLIF
jgi:hypothetical protein